MSLTLVEREHLRDLSRIPRNKRHITLRRLAQERALLELATPDQQINIYGYVRKIEKNPA